MATWQWMTLGLVAALFLEWRLRKAVADLNSKLNGIHDYFQERFNQLKAGQKEILDTTWSLFEAQVRDSLAIQRARDGNAP